MKITKEQWERINTSIPGRVFGGLLGLALWVLVGFFISWLKDINGYLAIVSGVLWLIAWGGFMLWVDFDLRRRRGDFDEETNDE